MIQKNSFYKHAQAFYTDISSMIIINKASRDVSRILDVDNPFFIIGIPGSLHLVDICLRFIPPDQKIIFISNGLSEWEYNWALDHFETDGFLRLPKLLEHGRVLDFLFKHFFRPFGILDYDCFVLNSKIFIRMAQMAQNTMLNAIFVHKNPILNIDIPETFFMYFNPELIRVIQQKYHASSRIRDFTGVSQKAKTKLSTLGIDGQHYPEEYKAYFDSTRLWYCLGVAEGYKCNFIERMPTVSEPSDQIFHVGGSSNNMNVRSKWTLRGSYFWRRSLEECVYPKLKQMYWDTYGKCTAKDLLEINPKLSDQISPKYLAFIEDIIHVSFSNK